METLSRHSLNTDLPLVAQNENYIPVVLILSSKAVLCGLFVKTGTAS